MKQLRKAGVSQDNLMFYYQSVVRPVLEYASPCWHLNPTKEQAKQLEDFQRRALQVISITYRMTKYVAHITFRHLLNVDLTLAEHFSRGSSETTRLSSGISCQPSVILNLRLDCAVLDNIQQSMRELIVTKILSLYMD